MKQIKQSLLTIIAVISVAMGMAQSSEETSAPVAYDISMSPIVQAAVILPFNASSANSSISSFTIETIPMESAGVLSLSMSTMQVPVSEGMMLTPDLANSLTFTPAPSFTGEVVFTYSATDENGTISNIAWYSIQVVGQPPVILPVTMLNFTGNLTDKKVQLNWQTTHENNCSYFELQRSSDGNNFETFATVTAKGNSNLTNSYQDTDDLFFYHFKTVYYRLKMVDANGNFKYSIVVTIPLDAAVNNTIKAWPLPFSSNLNIAYNSEANESIKLMLHSVNGSTIFQTTVIVTKGTNTIAFNQAQSIPAGTYLLTISNSTKAQTLKVIKN